jgi:hypothetical protein
LRAGIVFGCSEGELEQDLEKALKAAEKQGNKN